MEDGRGERNPDVRSNNSCRGVGRAGGGGDKLESVDRVNSEGQDDSWSGRDRCVLLAASLAVVAAAYGMDLGGVEEKEDLVEVRGGNHVWVRGKSDVRAVRVGHWEVGA